MPGDAPASLDPGEVRYRAELALRAKAGQAGETSEDEKYLVPSETVLARRGAFGAATSDATQAPDVADRQLYWRRAVVMHADRRVSELVHYAREIVIAPRTEDELYEEVPAEGDLSETLRARVHRADGGEAFPVEEANDDGRLRIKWPELAPGDVVEVAFRSWSAGPVGGRGDPPFVRLDYAGGLSTHPVLYNEVDVDTPADRPIYVDVVSGKADHRDEKDENGRHELRLVWDHPATVPDEPLAPPASEVLPTVVLSTFKDWSAFRSWYAEAVRGFTEPDAQVRELAAKLTRGKASRDAKLAAIFDFVADDIRYVNYVSGEWWLPNRPQQLLARREGDCDDKAILLITLLKAVGIEAQEVMVQTRLTGQPSLLRAPGAAIPLFDHGIAHLPGPGAGTYLDATSPQSRLGPLPSMDARAAALRMTGAASIVELPSSSPDDHGVDATWTLSLAADGSGDLEGEDRATGDDAFWMRTYLTEPGSRAQWMEDHLVGTWFSTVQVDKKVDFDGALPHGAATVRWHARSTGLARKEGSELVLALSPSQTMASRLAPLVERTLPVWLPPHVAPRAETHTIRVVAPKGWSFEALPEGRRGAGRLVRSRAPRGDPRSDQPARRPGEGDGGRRSKRDRRRRVPAVAIVDPAGRRARAQDAAPRARGGREVSGPRGPAALVAGLSLGLAVACGAPRPAAPVALHFDLPGAPSRSARSTSTPWGTRRRRLASTRISSPTQRAPRATPGRSPRSRPRSTPSPPGACTPSEKRRGTRPSRIACPASTSSRPWCGRSPAPAVPLPGDSWRAPSRGSPKRAATRPAPRTSARSPDAPARRRWWAP